MRDAVFVRTTLNLDDDVLETAKSMAARQRKPLGEVVSRLLRLAVEAPPAAPSQRNGMPLFPVSRGARPVTPELVKDLIDEAP